MVPVAAFLMIAGSQPMYSWSVPYLQESLGETATLAGVLVAVASATGAVFMVIAGLRADRVGADGRIRLIVTWCLAAAFSSSVILAGGRFGVAVAAPVGSGALVAATGSSTWAWIAACVSLVAAAVSYRLAGRATPLSQRPSG